jgi:hypothetical protein
VISTQGRAVEIATAADRRAFERMLLADLLGGHAYAVPVHHAEATITYTGSGCSYRGTREAAAGQVVVDTVNHSSRSFTWIAGRLGPGRSLAELARYALDPRNGGRQPPWFAVDASGDTPPHSAMTWQPYLRSGATGTTIVACGTASPPQAWLVARLSVVAAPG